MFSGVNDLWYGLRQLRRAPGPTLLILVALGVAIGANTTIFSIANALLMRPLGVVAPESLIRIGTTTDGDRYGITSWPDYRDLRDEVDGLDGLAAYGLTLVGLQHEGGTDPVIGEMVTWNYWRVLGVEPRPGRAFLAEEDREGAGAAVVILSHHLWQDWFGGDPEVIGSMVLLSDVPYTVVGVAPREFRGLSTVLRTDVWVPAMMVDLAYTWDINLEGRIDPWLNLVGRLRPGVAQGQVQASLDVVAERLQEAYPEDNEGKTFTAVALDRTRIIPSQTTDGARNATVMLLAVTVLVLVIACLNVANVFLARALVRRREIAMRSAMGASRGRIVRQLMTEGVLVAAVAAGLALFFTSWMVEVIWTQQPQLEVPLTIDTGVDGRVLAYTVAIGAFVALFFTLWPAAHAVRWGGGEALRVRDYRGGAGLPQRILVAGQVALTLVVLLTAGLFVRSLGRVMDVDPGYDIPHGLFAMVNLGYGQWNDDEARALFDQLDPRVEAIPGVASAALTTSIPMGPGGGRHDVYVPGYEPAPGEWMVFDRGIFDGDYLETMGIEVVEGRGIDDGDRADSRPVAVVNEAFARRFWPDESAVGKTLYADRGEQRTVVGVIGDVKEEGLDQPSPPYLAIPLSQASAQPRLILVVRTEGDPGPIAEPLRQEIASLLPSLPVNLMTVAEHTSQSQGTARGIALLASMAGLLGLIVALAGVYGVTAYTVSRRTHEFGVRMALGASASGIARMVLAGGLRTALAGVALGLLLAAGVARLVQGFLFEVQPLDPAVFGTVALGVTAVALLAVYLPARRAARTEPTKVLRVE